MSRLVFSAALFLLPLTAAEAAERPNLVVILADDLGYSDLGCYGGEISTPHLDRLAEEGVQFRAFYNDSKCSPTRASLLAGIRWHRTGTGFGSEQLTRENFTTLPRLLGLAGYRTGNFGKWHVSGDAGEHGFDTWAERAGGEDHFLARVETQDGKRDYVELQYGPDLYTDLALEFIENASAEGRPFFAFLAYYAPHFPLQAPEEWIAPHREVYLTGWDRLRRERYARQVQRGLVPADWELSPRDSVVPPWEALPPERQREEARLMAVYAAMVERLDWNVGRLMGELEARGLRENTLILFLSDNGACPWVFNKTPDLPPGPPESFRSYDSKWANACNTPFRYHKQWAHEGGIASPGIVSWPAGIVRPGRLSGYRPHVIDIMPTLLGLAGVPYPERFDGRELLPMEGKSFAAVFQGESKQRGSPLYWEFFGNRAVREGRWKLVAGRGEAFALYDMEADGTELRDLSGDYPERFSAMKATYHTWARQTCATPNERARRLGASNQQRIYPEE